MPVLSHRVVGKSFLQAGEFGAAEAIIRDIVDRLRVPEIETPDHGISGPEPGTRDGRTRCPNGRSPVAPRRLGRWLVWNLWPNQRLRWTREGVVYFGVWLGLLIGRPDAADQPDPAGRRARGRADGRLDLRQRRDAPEAPRVSRRSALLRLLGRTAGDRLHAGQRPAMVGGAGPDPRRRDDPGSIAWSPGRRPVLMPEAFFPRVAGRSRASGPLAGGRPPPGQVSLRTLDLATRSPFGLLERRVSISEPGADDGLPRRSAT